MDLKSNKQVVFSCKYHVIFCPKYRRKVLVGSIQQRLKEIIREVAAEKQVDIIEVECDKDHIYILCQVDPQYGIHRFVKAAKGRSSRILREEFPQLKSKLPCLWTHSYFVSTVGGAPLSVVKQYIENQKRSQRY
jgi:putative transposase